VSTKEQATKGGQTEGYSIPAQRDVCLRKAEALGAEVVEKFTDAGESARSANRPELQRMLRYITENPVDYLIVHKIDRLARNRADDVEISLALKAAGVTLVSCTENIDETHRVHCCTAS
jgi:DNA invertase Pin-like site-specific DNA recombinase